MTGDRGPLRWLGIAVGLSALVFIATACSSESSESGSAPDTTLVLSPAETQEQATDAATSDLDAGSDSTESVPSTTIDGEQIPVSPDLLVDVLPYIDWSQAGAHPATAGDVVSVVDFGASPDDGESDSRAFAQAIGAVGRSDASLGVVEIPPGRFLLTETLELPSRTVLRGAGQETVLTVDLAGRQERGIVAEGRADGTWTTLPAGAQLSSGLVEVSNSGRFAAGAIVEFEQDNDTDLMYTDPAWDVDWGDGSVGELGRIVAVEGERVRLESGLNSAYRADLGARVRTVRPVEQVGIESMTVERVDDGFDDTIVFRAAVDVWVHEVETLRTNSAHIEFVETYRCSVTDSVVHGASDFGDGGRAYGLSLARHTTDCLFMNNTLFDLRHAIIIQLGASGNVVAYNDARGSAGYEDRQPRADLSLHGHWPQANLFEGNIFDRVVFADWWGPVGPGNTLFRSCVADHVIVTDHSDDQAVVNNTIGSGGFGVDPSVERILSSGNRSDRSRDDSQPSADNAPASLWRQEAPDIGLDAWPPLTAGIDPADCHLPASGRSPFG